jgi:hypothetical protein
MGSGGGSLEEGVDTPLWLLTEPHARRHDRALLLAARRKEPNPQVEEADARRRLWDLAERSVNASPPSPSR